MSKYSAISSALGYLYQIRLALFESLRKIKEEEPFNVSIETLDDIEFETSNDNRELVQAKHKQNSEINLTDASTDLWKTIRIWCEGYKAGILSQNDIYFLVTTESASLGSAAFYLRDSDDRNIESAVERLRSTAFTSNSESNKNAYEAFKALTPPELKCLFTNVYVLDNAPTINDLSALIKKELFHLAEYKFLDSVIQRLEGWWVHRILKQLLLKNKPILSEEIIAETNRLREQFRSDNLPVDDDIILSEVDATGYQDSTFVKQLELIGINKKRISFAIRDYYRAFTQRSRWIRESLLYVGELDRYEMRLIEEWEIIFEQTYDGLPNDTGEEERKLYAQQIYQWIESNIHAQIRDGVNHPSLPKGTYQILADKLRVGWHLHYKERLEQLLN